MSQTSSIKDLSWLRIRISGTSNLRTTNSRVKASRVSADAWWITIPQLWTTAIRVTCCRLSRTSYVIIRTPNRPKTITSSILRTMETIATSPCETRNQCQVSPLSQGNRSSPKKAGGQASPVSRPNRESQPRNQKRSSSSKTRDKRKTIAWAR